MTRPNFDTDIAAAQEDFDQFLRERKFSQCEAIMDNLGDMGLVEVAEKMQRALAHARAPFTFLQDSHEMVFNSVFQASEAGERNHLNYLSSLEN